MHEGKGLVKGCGIYGYELIVRVSEQSYFAAEGKGLCSCGSPSGSEFDRRVGRDDAVWALITGGFGGRQIFCVTEGGGIFWGSFHESTWTEWRGWGFGDGGLTT